MDQFVQDAQKLLSVRLSGAQVDSFRLYEQELMTWNEKFNLTAIRDIQQIRNKHFLDSLTCVLAWGDKRPKSLIDIGTGAGFPGIPLKIIFPSLRLTLVESVGKKTKFCQHLVDILKLEYVEIIQDRAEVLGQNPKYREKFEWAVARAVANLPVLVEFLIPLVRLGGGVIAQKGESGPAETQNASNAIHILGGTLRQLMPVTIPGVVEERYLVIIDKKARTPKLYPRRPGIPAKQPLI
ncbi:MAG: 16S rRNA (guanine(527)-N(7))-methyltransferase RsmG [Anaerolineaceae bacterium]|nr:16S rRNA (guanine(527)-N(7))-methyltransferase RsmG [Anaerolineaceae bacterium]